MSQRWFSVNIRLVVLIETKGAVQYMDSVFLFRDATAKSAWAKAIQLGKSQEKEFVNDLGQRIRWKLKEIVSLDRFSLDSGEEYIEVYSEPREIKVEDGVLIPFDSIFHPENSLPTQSVLFAPQDEHDFL
jgi:hypothetical protein